MNPQEIIHDKNLSKAAKLRALKSCEEDQTALLRAADENMPAQAKEPDAARLLREIQEAERKLEAEN